MRVMPMFLAAIFAVLALAASAFALVGPERVWGVFGQPDLGSVNFETLERRTSPNDALTCPPQFCKAKSDLKSPIFSVDANGLRAAMAKVIGSEPRVALVHNDDAALTDRYLQRTALLGFPDTIVVRYIPLTETRSTIAMYSRSQIGRSDLGANKARLVSWLSKLEQLVPSAKDGEKSN